MKRVAAAELEQRLLEVAAGEGGHRGSGLLAAGQGHGPHGLMGDDGFDLLVADEQGLEHPLRVAGLPEQLLDVKGAAADVGGVLQQADVAGRERGRREADHLPEGEVPGHDREHAADGIAADEALVGIGRDRLRGQEGRGLLGVVVAGPGALRDLGPGLRDRLAHFQRDRARVAIDVPAQEIAGPGQQGAARGQRHLPPAREGGLRSREYRRQRPRRMARVGGDRHARVGIDALEFSLLHLPFSARISRPLRRSPAPVTAI